MSQNSPFTFSQNTSKWGHYMRPVQCHAGAVIAECERCGAKRLIKTKIRPDLFEGLCTECRTEGNEDSLLHYPPVWPSERSSGAHYPEEQPVLTFRTPTKIEIETMTPDEDLSRWVAMYHEPWLAQFCE